MWNNNGSTFLNSTISQEEWLTVMMNLNLNEFIFKCSIESLTSTSCTERGWATHSMLSSCRISSSMCCRASSFAIRAGWTCFCTWMLQTNIKIWGANNSSVVHRASCNLKLEEKMKVDEDQNQALFCTFNMMSTEAVVKLIVTPGMMHSSQAKVAFYDVRQQV